MKHSQPKIDIQVPDLRRRSQYGHPSVILATIGGGLGLLLLFGWMISATVSRTAHSHEEWHGEWGEEGVEEGETPFRPLAANGEPAHQIGDVAAVADVRLAEPIGHENLTVFLVERRRGGEPERPPLTLQEALRQGKVRVRETGAVSALTVENLTEDREILIQSGDIVKGGQQDRTFPGDYIVPPSSGPLAVASLCVEQGRWEARGDEPGSHFHASTKFLATTRQRRAVQSTGDPQSAIWSEVARLQERLSEKLGQSVYSPESHSSLQLSLESRSLGEAIAPYEDELGRALKGRENVVGCVIAVNGRVMSADVYASAELFRQSWSKLLESASIEAYLEHNPQQAEEPVSAEDAQAFLKAATDARPKAEGVTESTYLSLRQTETHLLCDSCDRSRENRVVHRSILARHK